MTATTTRYRVTFTRIGRNHAVAPLETEAATLEDLAYAVGRYALPHLGSREIAVTVDDEIRDGCIVVGGVRSAGTFRFERIPAATT